MTFKRHTRLLIGFAVIIVIIIARLAYIQIFSDNFKESSDNQTLQRIAIYPSRGVIYDRNGSILVGNRMLYDILVTPRELRNVKFDTLALAKALEIDPSYVKEKFKYYNKYRSRIGWRMQVFLKGVKPEVYTRFAELQYYFPGFQGVERCVREYPIDAGGNLLGYCGEVSETFIAGHPGEYSKGDYAGKTGIEASMEKELRGVKGLNVYVRGPDGHIGGSYKDGELDVDAVAGKNMVASIDANLQNYGQRLMKNKVGALVAIEPSTGEILTLVSSPSIGVECLEDFSGHYTALAKDRHRPMFNRAVASSYPPGSVFKIVNCLIGLQEGVLTPSTVYSCNRGYVYDKDRKTDKDKKVSCHYHRSPLNMTESIMASCNSYYCQVFKSILNNPEYKNVRESFSVWRDYVCSFGFGQKLGSDFPSELSGNIPTVERYDKIYRNKWNFGTVISLSIGQGEIGCTPLHLANLAATIANRGYYIIPHIVKDGGEVKIDDKFHERHYTMVDTLQFYKVIKGMYMAVNSEPGSGATATIARVPGLDICGKTGTAQNSSGDDHSVFICFAPRDNPRIAVAAYIENGGWGATWAAPIASLLVEKYLTGTVSRPELERQMMNGNIMYKVKPYK